MLAHPKNHMTASTGTPRCGPDGVVSTRPIRMLNIRHLPSCKHLAQFTWIKLQKQAPLESGGTWEKTARDCSGPEYRSSTCGGLLSGPLSIRRWACVTPKALIGTTTWSSGSCFIETGACSCSVSKQLFVDARSHGRQDWIDVSCSPQLGT